MALLPDHHGHRRHLMTHLLPCTLQHTNGNACLRQTYVYLASCMAGPLPMAEYFSEFAGGRSLLRFDYDPELPAADLPLGAPCSRACSGSKGLGIRSKVIFKEQAVAAGPHAACVRCLNTKPMA